MSISYPFCFFLLSFFILLQNYSFLPVPQSSFPLFLFPSLCSCFPLLPPPFMPFLISIPSFLSSTSLSHLPLYNLCYSFSAPFHFSLFFLIPSFFSLLFPLPAFLSHRLFLCIFLILPCTLFSSSWISWPTQLCIQGLEGLCTTFCAILIIWKYRVILIPTFCMMLC